MKKFIDSVGYAWRGIKTVFVQERNMRFHGVAALLVVALGYYYRITAGEWIAVLLCVGLVFILEIINTALETLVDLVQPQYDPLAGKVKDIAAGAVLVSAILSVVVGGIVFAKYVLN